MGKIAILGDCHAGARNDNQRFCQYQEEFFKTVFFPEMERQGIKHILQLGDMFDRRKYINFNTLYQWRKFFFDVIEEKGFTLHLFLGNHDIFLKESLEINSPQLLLRDYKSIKIYDKPCTVEIEQMDFCLIPWICSENEKEVLKEVKKTKASVCAGHFEFAGFAMYKGADAHAGGFDHAKFSKFDQVYSGHYHTESNRDNVTYTGIPYQLTWQDYGDQKKFFIYDTATRTHEKVVNNLSMFSRFEYDDSRPDFDADTVDESIFKNQYVKLIVKSKINLPKFDRFITRLYNNSMAYDIRIIEDMTKFQTGEITETVELEDSLSVATAYINSLSSFDTDEDKLAVQDYVRVLYLESINMEVV